MQLTVRFFTILREITGKKEGILSFPTDEKTTVDSALKNLAEHYGQRFREYIYDPRTGKVKGFLQFFINDKSTSALDGMQTELRDGDILAIVPPVGGG